MDKSPAAILETLVNRRVKWVDKRGQERFGTLREIRGDNVFVSLDRYGSSPPTRVRLCIQDLQFVEASASNGSNSVTYSLWKEANHFWRWEIKIHGELWRKRRGFKSNQTANESLKQSLLDAEEAARNLHPSAEALAAQHLWREEWMETGLGPADFYDRLSEERKQMCMEFVKDVARASQHVYSRKPDV